MVHICIHTYRQTFVYSWTYIHTHVNIDTHIHMHVCVCVCVRLCICLRVCMIYTYVFMCTHVWYTYTGRSSWTDAVCWGQVSTGLRAGRLLCLQRRLLRWYQHPYHTAMYCNTLQHTATRYTATHCDTLTQCNICLHRRLSRRYQHAYHTVTRCNKLKHT